MASSIQLLRSTNPQERPFAGNLLEGQPAANLHSSEPGLFFKTTDGSIVKFGPAAITLDGSPPNSTPQGSSGNSVGELWLDKSVDPAVLKVYDGTQWVDAGSGSGGGSGSFLRWIYTAIGGETSLSGSSGGVLLDYTPGLEEVYVNGMLITRGTDYSAINGTSITNLAPLTAGDVVTVLSMNPLETVQLPGQVTLLRWTILAAAGQTVLSGIDSSSQQLAYTAGFEEVYVNGAFLRRGLDYTATSGTSITLSSPLALDDEITVLAWSPFTVGDIVSADQVDFLQVGSTFDRTVAGKLGDFVSVKDFGAVGNGVVNDGPSIQNAIDSLSLSGGTVFFPRGDYFFTSGAGIEVKYSNIHLLFDQGAILLPDHKTQTRGITVASGTNNAALLTIQNIRITNATIDGKNNEVDALSNEYSHGISVRKADNVIIDSCTIKNVRGDGVQFAYGPTNAVVSNCYLESNSSAVGGARQGIAIQSGESIKVSNCSINGFIIGVDIEPDDNQINTGYSTLRDVIIENNRISNTDEEGVSLVTPLVTQLMTIDQITVTGNQFRDISTTCVEFKPSSSSGGAKNVIITSNCSNTSVTFKGVEVSRCDNAIISSNIFDLCDDYGIQVAYSDNVVISNNYVRNNTNKAAFFSTDNISTTRKKLALNNNIFQTEPGTTSVAITAPVDLVLNGGICYEGLAIGGRGTAGDDTKALLTVNGAKILRSTAGNALSILDFTLRALITGCSLQTDSSSSSIVTISASTGGTTYFSSNVYLLGTTNISASSAINDLASNVSIIDW